MAYEVLTQLFNVDTQNIVPQRILGKKGLRYFNSDSQKSYASFNTGSKHFIIKLLFGSFALEVKEK